MDIEKQKSAPLYEALERFRKQRVVPFDVPGHKRGRGNPELVPSWTNRFNIFYNDYIVDRQMGWFTRLYFNNTLNSIS